MDEMIPAILMLVFPVIAVSAVGTIIYVIVNNIKNKDSKFKLSSKVLLQIYLYVLSLLTLGIAVIGGVTAIRAGLSYQFGIPFSYTLYEANNFDEAKIYDPSLIRENFEICQDGQPLEIEGRTYCFNNQTQRTDVLNGITIFVSMLILFGMHQYALSKLRKEEKVKWLYKVYTFLSLIIYSIAGLVSIPMAIYQLTNYLIIPVAEYGYSTPQAPAGALAVVLLTVPLWVLFLKKTMSVKENGE